MFLFVCVNIYIRIYIYTYTVHNVVSNGIELTTKWISLPKPTIIIYIYKLVGIDPTITGCMYVYIYT